MRAFWDFTLLIPQCVENVVRAHNQRFNLAITYSPRTDDGIWAKRNWRGIPGICFTGETDNCLTGRMEAPANVLYDEGGGEFIFRQPRNKTELEFTIRAGMVDPFDEYGFDGHRRWTLASIREWWKVRRGVLDWIQAQRKKADPNLDQDGALVEYEFHLVNEAEFYLRTFAFFVDNGRCSVADDLLPELG